MRVESTLLVSENRFTNHSDPHAVGVITIPWSEVGKHPKLLEIGKALSKEDRQACRDEGVLRLTADYGFEEEYKDGIGLVMRDLGVLVDKLSDEKKAAIQDWLQTQYGIEPSTDEGLQHTLDSEKIKNHIVADMTVAGMGIDGFREALSAHAKQGELPYPLEVKDMDNIAQSMQDRGIGDADAYYNEVAMKIREQWPSPENKNYGYDEPGEAKVIFFTGFNCLASTVIKAGPYAYQPAWPDLENGFGDYDENGIANNEAGEIMPASAIEMDTDYIYHPYMAVSNEFKGKEALSAIDRWIEAHENPPEYNGNDNNCVGVAGDIIFGDKYSDMLKAIEIMDNTEDNLPKVTNAQLATSLLEGGNLPEGMHVSKIRINHESLTYNDIHGIKAAMHQVEYGGCESQLTSGFSNAVLDEIVGNGTLPADAIYQCDQAHLDV